MSQQYAINRTVIMLVACALLGFSLRFIFPPSGRQNQTAITAISGTILPTPRTIPPFEFTQVNGKRYTQENLRHHWTLMFFGFTQCPELCPNTMAELAKVYSGLQKQRVAKMPHVIMVTIDPKRDTLKKLGDYVHAFNPAFIGLRGDKKQIDTLAHSLGVVYMKTTHKDGKNYDINHNGAVMIFNPDGNLAGFFTTPHHAKAITADYMHLVS